jgi:hypothetical protein
VGDRAKISVAIASYNGAAFIGEQLASIAAQTRLPDELVVSDDGSQDETCAIVEAFAKTAPFPVRLLRQTARLGILDNFYAAFGACTGDILVYCDQDDVWMPEKLARQEAAIAAGAVLVAHSSLIVDDKLVSTGRTERSNFVSGFVRTPVDPATIFVFGHQLMFTRPVLDMMRTLRADADALPGTYLSHSFDNYIPFCASLLGGITLLPEPLIAFRRHCGATSGAGVSADDAREPIGGRAASVIRYHAAFAEDQFTLTEIALERGLVPAAIAGPLAAALARKRRLVDRMVALEKARSLPARLLRLPGALAALARPMGFGNQRRLHSVGIAGATLFR